MLERVGCLREDERTGRAGGGMSVFFGATGSPFCCLTVSLRLTGDVGIRPTVLVLVGRVVGFADDGIRS